VRHMYRQLTVAIPSGQPSTVRSLDERVVFPMHKWSHGGQSSFPGGVYYPA
jgi:hypothetical protein